MTDINKQIEEAQYDFHSEEARSELEQFGGDGTITTDWAESCIRTAELEAFEQGAKFVLSLNRWRKVSEELPEVSDNKILVELQNGTIEVAEYKDIIDENYLRQNGARWKPID